MHQPNIYKLIERYRQQNSLIYISTLPLTSRLLEASDVEIRNQLQLFYLIALVKIRTRYL